MPDDSAAAAPRDPDEEVRFNLGTHGRERRAPGGTNHESHQSHESYKGFLIREIRVIRGGSASFFPVALTGYPVIIPCDSRYLNGMDRLDSSPFNNLSIR